MEKCFLRAISVSLATALCLLCHPQRPILAADTSPLSIFVFHRPPYYILKNGKPAGGFLLDIALDALQRANIPFVIEEMPPARILTTLEQNKRPACSVGWIKTPERNAFAWFSQPMYFDAPLGVAVRADMPLPQAPSTMTNLLRIGWTWGLRAGFSYGPHLDQTLAAYPETKERRFSSPDRMLHLLVKHRLDAVLIEPEEMAWLVRDKPELATQLRYVHLDDAPPRTPRHIMCNHAVTEDIMNRINTALSEAGSSESGQRHVATAIPKQAGQ